MSQLQNVAIAVILIALILVGVWYLRKQFRADIQTATEQIETSSESGNADSGGKVKGSTSVPIRDRPKAFSFTAKIMFGSIGLLVLILAVFIFQTLRTGSPAEVMFSDQIITGILVFIGFIGGVIATNMSHRSRGTLINIYEDESGNTREEEIPIDVSTVDTDSEGYPVVKEYSKRPVFGLFWRYKHVAEEPELEGTHRAPGKIIEHQIGDHANSIGDSTWVQMTEQQNPTKDPDTKPDYVYSSPIEISYEKYVQEKEAKRRKDIQLQGMKTTHAVLSNEFEKLARMLKSGQYKSEKKLMEKFDQISSIVNQPGFSHDGSEDPRSTHVNVNGNGQGQNQNYSGASQRAETDGGERQ